MDLEIKLYITWFVSVLKNYNEFFEDKINLRNFAV